MTEAIEIDIQRTQQSRIKEVDFSDIAFGKHYTDHMFIADYLDGQWTDLRVVPYDYLRMSPANATLHYGQTIFEGLKAYKGNDGEILIFRPEKNAQRFNRSALRMCMPEIPEEIFMSGLRELISLDAQWVPDRPGTALYVRPFMFAADEYIGVKPSDTYKFMIFCSPVGAYYSKPVKVKIEKQYVRSADGGTGAAKTGGNYAGSLYPTKRALQQGYDQIIWTDSKTHSYIEEAGTMNIMMVIDDTLVTPATSGTILEGITRDSILTLARDWGMKVEERKVSVDEIMEAIKAGKLQEAFGAGTAATVAPIQTIGYEGQDYDLPPVESSEFSKKILTALEDIKHGRSEDKFGWITTV